MIDRSDRRSRRRRALQALGAAAGAAVALTGACGGNVVVDTSTGTGSGGATASSATTYGTGIYATGTYSTGTYGDTTFEAVSVGPSSGTGTPGGCVIPSVPPGEYAMTICVPSTSCSQDYTAELSANLAQVLDVCDPQSGNCCGGASLLQIDCGPTIQPGGGCCYVATVIEDSPCPD